MSAMTPVGLEIEIEGVNYTLSPLDFSDIEWLELRLRSRAIEAGRLSIPADVLPAEREKLLGEILDQAQKIDLFSSLEALLSVTGVTALLYRMTRKHSPTVTLEQVSGWVRDSETMEKIRPQLTLLMGVKKKSQTQEIPPPP